MPTLDEAKKQLETHDLHYLIIGIMTDGKKGIPANYQMTFTVATKQDIYENLKNFAVARVYSLAEFSTPEYWQSETQRYFDKKTEAFERAEYHRLKLKYDREEVQKN